MGVLQSIDNAREENVGSHGVKSDALNAALKRTEGALEWLRARHADRGLPLLRLPETRGDLEVIRDTARQLADRASDIVILGTGGSSLGGQTLAQLAGFAVPGVGSLRPPPRLHFIDNLGIDYIQRRSSLIDAVTIEDAKKAARRLYGAGMLVTVAGRPKGLASSGTTE